MPCIYVNWKEGKTPEQKTAIREQIAEKVSANIGVGKQYVTIFFNDMPAINVPHIGTLVWLYWTVGRSDEDKDEVVAIVTDAIHEITDTPISDISVMIFDIPRGNLAGSGKILNRSGSVADQLKAGKSLDDCK